MFGRMLLDNVVAGQYIKCAICKAQYSAYKNYVLCMPEFVGNYSIPTANGNVQGGDMLAGAGILNFLNIYVQQTPVNAPQQSVDNSWFLYLVSSGVHKQFLSKLSIYRPNLYWQTLLVSCTIVSLKGPTLKLLDSALTKLENWLKANKHTKLNQMCHKQ